MPALFRPTTDATDPTAPVLIECSVDGGATWHRVRATRITICEDLNESPKVVITTFLERNRPAGDAMSEPDETDGAMLAGLRADAEAWAREFLRLNPHAAPGRDSDEALDLTRAWFANAIEIGHEAGYTQAKREANPDWPFLDTEDARDGEPSADTVATSEPR